MAVPLFPLGAVPGLHNLGPWLLAQAARHGLPWAQRLIQDPGGAVRRVGDIVCWEGEKGRQVLATLESLTESQDRIGQAVKGLETGQASLAGGLGSLANFSVAAFGVTSLMSAWLIVRLGALHQRMNAIQDQLTDLKALAEAPLKGNLKRGLDFLELYERRRSDQDLHTALENCNHATHVYRDLVEVEVGGKRRLIALNQCGRFYLLALTAEVRCLLLSDQAELAEQRLLQQKPALTGLARATFGQVLGKSPELYFDPGLQDGQVTLDLLTEVFRQASAVGAWDGPSLHTPGEVFEHFRARIYGNRGWFRALRQARVDLLSRLRYLIACLEEVGRMESLRLRIEEARRGALSLGDLERQVKAAADQSRSAGDGAAGPVVAFAIG